MILHLAYLADFWNLYILPMETICLQFFQRAIAASISFCPNSFVPIRFYGICAFQLLGHERKGLQWLRKNTAPRWECKGFPGRARGSRNRGQPTWFSTHPWRALVLCNPDRAYTEPGSCHNLGVDYLRAFM